MANAPANDDDGSVDRAPDENGADENEHGANRRNDDRGLARLNNKQ